LAEEAGWTIRAVEKVFPPAAGTAKQFMDQFTKLRIFEFEEYAQILYLDSDCLVVGDINDLWKLPVSFAAVPDFYGDARGYTKDFNAGVLLIQPSKALFSSLMKSLPVVQFERSQAEQSFLRVIYKFDTVLLPYKYNGNLAIQRSHPDDWRHIWQDMRIIHFTLKKPFLEKDLVPEFHEAFLVWHRTYREMNVEKNTSQCCKC